jgi:hypothetical protein
VLIGEGVGAALPGGPFSLDPLSTVHDDSALDIPSVDANAPNNPGDWTLQINGSGASSLVSATMAGLATSTAALAASTADQRGTSPALALTIETWSSTSAALKAAQVTEAPFDWAGTRSKVSDRLLLLIAAPQSDTTGREDRRRLEPRDVLFNDVAGRDELLDVDDFFAELGERRADWWLETTRAPRGPVFPRVNAAG